MAATRTAAALAALLLCACAAVGGTYTDCYQSTYLFTGTDYYAQYYGDCDCAVQVTKCLISTKADGSPPCVLMMGNPYEDPIPMNIYQPGSCNGEPLGGGKCSLLPKRFFRWPASDGVGEKIQRWSKSDSSSSPLLSWPLVADPVINGFDGKRCVHVCHDARSGGRLGLGHGALATSPGPQLTTRCKPHRPYGC